MKTNPEKRPRPNGVRTPATAWNAVAKRSGDAALFGITHARKRRANASQVEICSPSSSHRSTPGRAHLHATGRHPSTHG